MGSRQKAVEAWESLFRAQVSVMQALSVDFPSDEISLNEYDVLFNVSRQPGRQVRQRDLTKHVLITQPSISRLVDRLVARGWLSKCADPTDGRGAIISLTDEGFELFRRVARDHMGSITDRVGTVLTDAELVQLTMLCDKLRTGAKQLTVAQR